MVWKDSLKIGVPVIDQEHKQLCDQIDQLFAACSQGKGRSEILQTLDFLKDYTVRHFQHEEQLQRASAYPKCREHKAMHDNFIKQVSDMQKEITENGTSIVAVSKVNTLIMDWLVNHIRMVDKELEQYIEK
jgi:hemerythrin